MNDTERMERSLAEALRKIQETPAVRLVRFSPEAMLVIRSRATALEEAIEEADLELATKVNRINVEQRARRDLNVDLAHDRMASDV